MAPKTFDDLSSSLDERIGGLRKNYDTALESYFQSPQITPSQALIQGVLNVLPMIIGGAVAKKKGALLGAQAGKLGADTYLGGVATENKRKQDNAGLEAKRISDELQTTIGQKQQTELAGIKENATASRFKESEGNKFARTDATNATTLRAAQEMKVNPIESEVFKSQVSAEKIGLAADGLLAKLDKLPQTENPVEATLDNMIAKLDPRTDRAAVQRDLLKAVGTFKDQVVGAGVMSEQDFDRTFTVVGGKWNMPAQTIREITRELKQKAIDDSNATRAVGERGNFRMKFPALGGGQSGTAATPQAQRVMLKDNKTNQMRPALFDDNGEFLGFEGDK